MAKLKLSAPWDEFYHKVELMFANDSDIRVIYDEEDKHIKLYVQLKRKADALSRVLPNEKNFGGQVLKISVIPPNADDEDNTEYNEDDYAVIFENNSALSFIRAVYGIFNFPIYYVVFKNQVVQYFNDNLGDIYGQESTLYQDIAKEIFKPIPGVFFCTDKPESVGMPLGEWP